MYIILILVCESLMSKYVKHYSTTSKIRLNTPFWGVSACRFFTIAAPQKTSNFAGMTFQRERQKSFGSFGIYPLVICYIAIEHGNL